MRRIALILIALAAGTGNSWAQSAEWPRLVSVARDRSLNDGARLSALDSLNEFTPPRSSPTNRIGSVLLNDTCSAFAFFIAGCSHMYVCFSCLRSHT